MATVVVLMAGGVVASGCSSSPAASPAPSTTSATSTPVAFTGTPLAWLTDKARPFNKELNDDQALIDSASVTSTEIGAATFFAHLAATCTRLNTDAQRAQRVQAAPSASLESAWLSMTAHTEAYAADCLALTHTRSSAALARWKQSLTAMNRANAALNTVVDEIRGQSDEATPSG